MLHVPGMFSHKAVEYLMRDTKKKLGTEAFHFLGAVMMTLQNLIKQLVDRHFSKSEKVSQIAS